MAAKKTTASKPRAKKAKPAAYKLDIGEVLSSLDYGDHTYFQKLDEDKQKGFEPFVVMRMLSSTEDTEDFDIQAFQVQAVNQVVNRRYKLLTKHPEMLWKLMASCGLGWRRRHPWIPPAGRGKKATRVDALLRRYAPDASDTEIAVLRSVNTAADLLALAEDYAMSDTEIADLRKELQDIPE